MVLHCALKTNAFSVALPCIDDNVTVIFKKRSICNILNGRILFIWWETFSVSHDSLTLTHRWPWPLSDLLPIQFSSAIVLTKARQSLNLRWSLFSAYVAMEIKMYISCAFDDLSTRMTMLKTDDLFNPYDYAENGWPLLYVSVIWIVCRKTVTL